MTTATTDMPEHDSSLYTDQFSILNHLLDSLEQNLNVIQSFSSSLSSSNASPKPNQNISVLLEICSEFSSKFQNSSPFLTPFALKSLSSRYEHLFSSIHQLRLSSKPKFRFSARDRLSKSVPEKNNSLQNSTDSINENTENGSFSESDFTESSQQIPIIQITTGVQITENMVSIFNLDDISITFKQILQSNDISFSKVKGVDHIQISLNSLIDKDLRISNCKNISICIPASLGTVFIDRIENCHFFIGPVNSAIFIHDANNCSFQLISRQLRIHNTTNSIFQTHLASGPIIEDSTQLTFGPIGWTSSSFQSVFSKEYPTFSTKFSSLLTRLGIPSLDNDNAMYSKISDFNHLHTDEDSPNYTISDFIPLVDIAASSDLSDGTLPSDTDIILYSLYSTFILQSFGVISATVSQEV